MASSHRRDRGSANGVTIGDPIRVLAELMATVALAGPCANGYVALTYDDGPTAATAGLLDALTHHDLRATMFDIGRNARARPDAVRAQRDAGMWIGNHTRTHRDLTTLSRAAIRREIRVPELGDPPLLRPPLLASNRRVRRVLRRHHLTQVLATVDTHDYDGASVKAIVRAVRTAGADDIVLMHDWAPNATRAVPRIARVLARKRLCPGRIRAADGVVSRP